MRLHIIAINPCMEKEDDELQCSAVTCKATMMSMHTRLSLTAAHTLTDSFVNPHHMVCILVSTLAVLQRKTAMCMQVWLSM